MNPHWWRELLAGMWHSLADWLPRGIMGWLLGTAMLAAVSIGPLAALVDCEAAEMALARLGRAGKRQRAGHAARSSSTIVSNSLPLRLGLQRRAGQTPREFAAAAAARLATASGPRICATVVTCAIGPCWWPRPFTTSVLAGRP